MRRLPFALLGLVGVGCGSRALVPDAAASDAADAAAGADVAAPVVCADAMPVDATTHQTPPGRIFCGGELAVAGPTPLGWWEPKAVRSSFRLADCYGLSISFDDGVTDAGEPANPMLTVSLTRAKVDQPWSGIFETTGFFVSGASPDVSQFPTTVEIISATALFEADAGQQELQGLGPRGLVVGRIDADTGCGHVTGTFSVPYCSWAACINR